MCKSSSLFCIDFKTPFTHSRYSYYFFFRHIQISSMHIVKESVDVGRLITVFAEISSSTILSVTHTSISGTFLDNLFTKVYSPSVFSNPSSLNLAINSDLLIVVHHSAIDILEVFVTYNQPYNREIDILIKIMEEPICNNDHHIWIIFNTPFHYWIYVSTTTAR